MRNTLERTRFWGQLVGVGFLIVFVLIQAVPFPQVTMGPLCAESMEAAKGGGGYPAYETWHVGMPFAYLVVHSEGCFEERVTKKEFHALRLAGNMAIVTVVALAIFVWPGGSDEKER